MIYVMVASEADLKIPDMVMKTQKLLLDILFCNRKSGVSGMLRDFRTLVLLQNVKARYLLVSYIFNLQKIF